MLSFAHLTYIYICSAGLCVFALLVVGFVIFGVNKADVKKIDGHVGLL